jgi:hypothetical protein
MGGNIVHRYAWGGGSHVEDYPLVPNVQYPYQGRTLYATLIWSY